MPKQAPNFGFEKNSFPLFLFTFQRLFYGRRFKYAFAASRADILDQVAILVEQKKVTIDELFMLESRYAWVSSRVCDFCGFFPD